MAKDVLLLLCEVLDALPQGSEVAMKLERALGKVRAAMPYDPDNPADMTQPLKTLTELLDEVPESAKSSLFRSIMAIDETERLCKEKMASKWSQGRHSGLLGWRRHPRRDGAVCDRAKLDKENFWLHKFRAIFATRCLWADVDLRTVQQWLGHSGHGVHDALSEAVVKSADAGKANEIFGRLWFSKESEGKLALLV
jgi:hypothetical protein